MKTDLWYFYENMLRSRLFEEEVTRVWNEGKISGEMHLSLSLRISRPYIREAVYFQHIG